MQFQVDDPLPPDGVTLVAVEEAGVVLVIWCVSEVARQAARWFASSVAVACAAWIAAAACIAIAVRALLARVKATLGRGVAEVPDVVRDGAENGASSKLGDFRLAGRAAEDGFDVAVAEMDVESHEAPIRSRTKTGIQKS